MSNRLKFIRFTLILNEFRSAFHWPVIFVTAPIFNYESHRLDALSFLSTFLHACTMQTQPFRKVSAASLTVFKFHSDEFGQWSHACVIIHRNRKKIMSQNINNETEAKQIAEKKQQ